MPDLLASGCKVTLMSNEVYDLCSFRWQVGRKEDVKVTVMVEWVRPGREGRGRREDGRWKMKKDCFLLRMRQAGRRINRVSCKVLKRQSIRGRTCL